VGNIRTCSVSFTDPLLFRHTVEVTAESLYEAVLLAMRAFRGQDWMMREPSSISTLELEVRAPSVTHRVQVGRVYDWLNSSGTPKEMVLKHRLKQLVEEKEEPQ
jgi:hypothetical protein